ncbi:MAG: alpha/beta hydrolase [Nocardioidaceae bacterium]
MPSLRHQLLAHVVPRVRRARELVDEDTERARLEALHAGLRRGLPTRAVPGFARRWSVEQRDAGGFPSFVITPRGRTVTRTLVHLHGGAFVAPIDAFHVRWATRVASAIGARVVMADYPLTPEHTWRDSHDQLTEIVARWAGEPGGAVLAGDSAGGNLALSVALSLRDRGLPLPTHLVLHAPWVDLTTSTPETARFAARDPWLHLGKLHAYARWWAGSEQDLGRPEVSPALADLDGLPPGLLFYGTRDLLAPGCRLLARRAAASTWDLTAVEEADLIHVYSILPTLPEARRALARTLEFLG